MIMLSLYPLETKKLCSVNIFKSRLNRGVEGKGSWKAGQPENFAGQQFSCPESESASQSFAILSNLFDLLSLRSRKRTTGRSVGSEKGRTSRSRPAR